jgi:predicted dehydrogenase
MPESAPSTEDKREQQVDKVRYAIVGAGWISQEAFMPSVAQTRNSEMTAIITGNRNGAKKLAEFYGIEHIFSYEEYDEALASGLFDAVYIALPNSMHADYTIRALRKGIHCLVEKPLAVSVDECEAMIGAAWSSGALLMTAYRLHNEPGTVEAIRLIREGAIGDPRLFTSTFCAQVDAGNHRLRAAHWGGPLQDVGVYCLNAARHVFGSEPTEAIAMKGHGTDPRFGEVEEALVATLRFPGDGLACFAVSFNAADIDTYQVVGTKGSLVMLPGFRLETPTRMILTRGAERTEKTFADVDHFGGQTAYFSDCIRTGTQPESDGTEGLADVRALLAIEAAAATGMPQPIANRPRPSHPDAETVRLVERTNRRLLL